MATSHLPIFVILYLSFTSLSFSERCHPNDKKALLQFKKDLNNPHSLPSWDPNTDCCDWHEVGCDHNTNRSVIIVLYDFDLKLPIPASIGDLPYLRQIRLNTANITGQIPRAISKLSELRFLDLGTNLLTGPVPAWLGHLKNLRDIDLEFNSLTGSIPASLSQLTELTGLSLNGNKLTGSIPESFGDFKQKGLRINLSRNQLSGPIPRKLGYARFGWIGLSRNRLEGDISFLFGKNKVLHDADFSRNQFEFDISKVEFPTTLTTLYLDHNKIYGSLPEGLAKIDLSGLNVSYNRLCGQIPVGGRLQEFDKYAYLNNKCLCGAPLPPCK